MRADPTDAGLLTFDAILQALFAADLEDGFDLAVDATAAFIEDLFPAPCEENEAEFA